MIYVTLTLLLVAATLGLQILRTLEDRKAYPILCIHLLFAFTVALGVIFCIADPLFSTILASVSIVIAFIWPSASKNRWTDKEENS